MVVPQNGGNTILGSSSVLDSRRGRFVSLRSRFSLLSTVAQENPEDSELLLLSTAAQEIPEVLHLSPEQLGSGDSCWRTYIIYKVDAEASASAES